jgi:hypothetical protein
MTDWMPANPCKDCDIDDKERREHRYGFDNECQCDDLYCYFQEVYYQKKLLEHQLAKAKAMKSSTTQTELGLWIESMIEQLERKDG